MFEAVDVGVSLARDGGAGDIEVADIDQAALANRCRAENHVLQLPHVARPAIAEQRRVSSRGEAADRALNLRAGLLHEVTRQQQNVLAAFTQRRHFDIEHVEAIEQVFAEQAFADHFLQIAVGRAEDAHVDLYFTITAHPTKAAVVEETQQFGLQVRRHLTDLIEKHRALVGQFHQPRFTATRRAGEGAGGVAEQFALGEVFRQRRAVEGEKRCAVPRTDRVTGAGHQLFTGTGFALNQQRCIQGGDPLCTGLERADHRGLAEQGVEAFGVVVVQCRELFADAVRLKEGQQGAGVGDRRGVEQQALTVDGDLAQRQAKAIFEQRVEQAGIIEQRRDAFARRLATVQRDQRRVGQQHLAGAVEGQHRVGHRREQGVELQVPTLAGEDVDHRYRLDAAYPEQRIFQFFEHLRAQGRRVDVDVRRNHLHRIQIEIAPTEDSQDFLGDADAVDEADVDTHGGGSVICRAEGASMPWA